MGKAKKWAYEQERCIVCGDLLEHAATGRPRRFCGDACKQKDYRCFKQWIKQTVDAELAGDPELPMSWRFQG